MNRFYVLLFFLTYGLLSCNEKGATQLAEHTRMEAVYYKLDVTDTSEIVIPVEKGLYAIRQYAASLICKRDTIEYLSCDSADKSVYSTSECDIVKLSYSTPSVKEYYCTHRGSLMFSGYSTGDSLFPLVHFSAPLVIFPRPGVTSDTTSAIKQDWSTNEQRFIPGRMISTRVREIKTINIKVDDKNEEAKLYELTLTGDVEITYGGQNLLVPGAIFMQSMMVKGKREGLLCEWSIKKGETALPGYGHNRQPYAKDYLELIIYKPIE